VQEGTQARGKNLPQFSYKFSQFIIALAKKLKHKTAYNNMSLIKICFVLLCCNFLYHVVVVVAAGGWLRVKSRVQATAAASDIVSLAKRNTAKRTARRGVKRKLSAPRLVPNIGSLFGKFSSHDLRSLRLYLQLAWNDGEQICIK
jgi:hypothetical protein